MIGIALTASAGCGPRQKGEAGAGPVPSFALVAAPDAFSTEIEPILIANCAGCHSPGSKVPPVVQGDEAAFRANGAEILASLQPRAKKRMPFHHRPLNAAEEGKLRAFLQTTPAAPTAPPRPATRFGRDVLPILIKACGACHTPGSNILPILVADPATFLSLKTGILASLEAPLDRGRMPPPRLRGPLTPAERRVLEAYTGE